MKKIRQIAVKITLVSICFSGCHSINKKNEKGSQEQANMRITYDDSTLTGKVLPIMMPYNRLIDPAGKVVRFGDPLFENHSLDIKNIPQSSTLVVEDRYGITLIDTTTKKVITSWTYKSDKQYNGLMSTYSGLKLRHTAAGTQIFWSAANGGTHRSFVMQAFWDGKELSLQNAFVFNPVAPSPLALPNELAIHTENGRDYLYVVLNGNNQIEKIDLNTKKTIWNKPTGVAPYGIAIIGEQVFLTNWGGPLPGADSTHMETAGVPYGSTYINPQTGATARGSVQVINQSDGNQVKEIAVGLHPNAIIPSKDGHFLYVANANSDMISVISVADLSVTENIPVRLVAGNKGFIGDSPNALAINDDGTNLYAANGLDNAVALIKLGQNASLKGKGKSVIKGFIPTEAYPGGLLLDNNTLFVTNLEGEGSRTGTDEFKTNEVPQNVTAYNSHHELATISIIPLPGDKLLKQYTERVKKLNLTFREKIARLTPRSNIAPKPIPDRIGEPSVFKHVLYIIKENRTYDQVLGDIGQGNSMPSLCIFGNNITPNQHQLAKNF
ncbi:MAG: hypothetical protein JWP44_65, partial [Mucilaginibacter sp.]|nr:hypothetical protein [Mucilaginibacter sp.]